MAGRKRRVHIALYYIETRRRSYVVRREYEVGARGSLSRIYIRTLYTRGSRVVFLLTRYRAHGAPCCETPGFQARRFVPNERMDVRMDGRTDGQARGKGWTGIQPLGFRRVHLETLTKLWYMYYMDTGGETIRRIGRWG